MLALSPLPCGGLEIGRAIANSSQGEPLDAMARIVLAPGEKIDNSCLSVGTREDIPGYQNALLTEARLDVLESQRAIHITTSRPVNDAAISLAIRVRCSSAQLTIRVINLQLAPTAIRGTPEIDSTLPGTVITARPGDSIYRLSRSIYPHNEQAVRDLSRAIILANPALFPNGRGRPLQIGERMIVPDLRTIQQIVADSPPRGMTAVENAPSRTSAPEKTNMPPVVQVATRKPSSGGEKAGSGATRKRATESVARQPGESAPVLRAPDHNSSASARLKLKLTYSLDLSRSKGMNPADRAALRRKAEARNTAVPSSADLAQTAGLSLHINRIRESQDNLNTRLARLETQADALRKAIIEQRTQRPASAPSSTPPVPTLPKPVIVSEPDSMTTPRATANWPTWFGIGALMLVLAFVTFLLGRKFQNRRALADQSSRIDEMLEQARNDATPLLDSEPEFPFGDTYSGASVDDAADDESIPQLPVEEYDDLGMEDTQRIEVAPEPSEPSLYIPAVEPPLESAPEETEPTLKIPAVEIPSESMPEFTIPESSAGGSGPSAPDEPSEKLRLEMDKAMDSTRTMFSDVDRFIMLGRIQNAISLLEFQIKRNPRDRDSWIKLMAVYRSQAMDGDFDRIYSTFRDQFGD